MNSSKKIFLVFLVLVFFSISIFAQVTVNFPLPGNPLEFDNVSISVDNKEVAGGIAVSDKTEPLLGFKGIEPNIPFYFSINTESVSNIQNLSAGAENALLTEVSFPDAKAGKTYFFQTDKESAQLFFPIGEWNKTEPFTVTLCQDKDQDSQCTGDKEKVTVTVKPPEAIPSTVCGNGVQEGKEECDKTVPAGVTCNSLGFGDGTLSCNDDCTINNSQCVQSESCGNNVIEEPELCDGSNLGDYSCEAIGFESGTVSCSENCSSVIIESCLPFEQNPVLITVNGESTGGDLTGNEIEVDTTTINIGLREIEENKNFFVAINESLSQKVTEITTGKDEVVSPPFSYPEVKGGTTFFAQTSALLDEILFSITDWDKKENISIQVCQDKDNDGTCSKQETASAVIIPLEENKPPVNPPSLGDLKYSEIQSPNGNTIKDLGLSSNKVESSNKISVSVKYLFETPNAFVLKIDGVDTEQNLWLSNGTASCEKISEEQKGIVNLQAQNNAEVWGEKAGEAVGEAVYEGSVWTGRNVKTAYEYTAEGVGVVWSVLKAIPSGFIKGLTGVTEDQEKEKVKTAHTTAEVELNGQTRREIPLKNVERNKSYEFEKGSGLSKTMFLLVEKIDGKSIKELVKGEKIPFFACQKTAENKLREAKVEIEFGKKSSPPVQIGTCSDISGCLSNVSKLFSQKLFEN